MIGKVGISRYSSIIRIDRSIIRTNKIQKSIQMEILDCTAAILNFTLL